MIRVNCDIGEREPDNPVDIEIMNYIHIANIACGGHAGDGETVRVFRDLAEKNDVEVAAHLSYPDKENFGRLSMDISIEDQLLSLDEQYKMMPDVKMVKFHGALYNDCSADSELAEALAQWLGKNNIAKIITPHNSELAKFSEKLGIKVLAEAFAERRYNYCEQSGRLSLVSRQKDYASIHDCDEAVENSRSIVQDGQINSVVEADDGSTIRKWVPIKADTICIHSDSVISLDLAKTLSEMK